MAAFGRSALASRDISATIERAVDVVMEVLNAPMGSVIRPLARPGRFAVVYGRGPIGLAAGQEYDVAPELMALHGTAEPLAVPDWNTETRFPRVRAGQAAGVQATLSVSVLVDGRAWGRLSVFWAGPRQLSGADVDVIQSIAHVLAAALERDRIETRLRRTAQDLQRALLPGALPTAAGIVTAARYAPAGGDQVGGDWYDVLELPQGGVGLVMGDVEGHDTAAAAVMGQVRNVLRAYASEGHSPAEVMTRVNRFVLRHTELLVTCCYAELHPAERSLTCVTAGHPAPLLLAPDGSSHPVQLVPGALLGVDEVHYAEQTAVLPTGATLLLVTDGLVDDLPGAIHPGPDAFAAVAHDRVGGSVDALADALITRPPGAPVQRDDAALLVVRLTAPAVAGDSRSAAGGVDGAGAGSGGAGGRAAGGTVGGRAGGGTVGGRTVGGTVVGTVV
ncbi:MAG TPA: GAF domain-containing SpoIIE family protein phosphatase, partial [Kineosporiaceae bacterium]|nr:GAF domain-containing SpoIIE family protein phosphatase [Kineosporiaceae bacterium]